jgi:acetolactate synthase I/II/III large subunit
VADSSVAIPLLTQELGWSRAQAERTIGERFKHIKAHHEDQERAARERLIQVQSEQPIEFEWVSHCIDQIKDDETILVNEYDLNLTQVQLTLPGSYFAASPAAGLGWGTGAALGGEAGGPREDGDCDLG